MKALLRKLLSMLLVFMIGGLAFSACEKAADKKNPRKPFEPVEKTISSILVEVRKSLRQKNEGGWNDWTVDHQPLNRAVMRYIILYGPDGNRSGLYPSPCRPRDDVLASLRQRGLDVSPAGSGSSVSVKMLKKAILQTDEMKIYNTYVSPLISPYPSIEELKYIALSYIHSFGPNAIIRDRLLDLSGCTGAARLFGYYAKMEGLEIEYVYLVDKENYNRVCPRRGGPEYTKVCSGHTKCDPKHVPARDIREILLNGHQVVAVKAPSVSTWRILNASSSAIDWATSDEQGLRVLEKNDFADFESDFDGLTVVFFHDKTDKGTVTSKPHFVAHVGDDIAFNHADLMKIYTRGSLNEKTSCVWPND